MTYNRLADEAAYFGAVADGVESQQEKIADLRQQLAERDAEAGTAWAQAHRLAHALECLIMDTKDSAIVSKWWDSAFGALEEYNKLKSGAEDAKGGAKMRKVGI
jgi:hypothetical protein